MKIFPIFLPNLGCSVRCIFCNQQQITNTQYNDLIQYISYSIETVNLKNIDEIAIYGSSFTNLPLHIQKEILELLKKHKVFSIRISTYPIISKVNLELLKTNNVKTIELGIQSIDKQVLTVCKRKYTTNDIQKTVKLIKEIDFKLSLQMMIGLPNSTFEKELQTAEFIISQKPNYVRIYPTLIIENTELHKMYKREKFQPINLRKAVIRSAILFQKFEKKGIKVIKTGLTLYKKPIKGPYHKAFGDLVKSEIMWQKLLISPKIKIGKILIIKLQHKINNFGYKKINLYRLKRVYNSKIIILLNPIS